MFRLQLTVLHNPVVRLSCWRSVVKNHLRPVDIVWTDWASQSDCVTAKDQRFVNESCNNSVEMRAISVYRHDSPRSKYCAGQSISLNIFIICESAMLCEVGIVFGDLRVSVGVSVRAILIRS